MSFLFDRICTAIYEMYASFCTHTIEHYFPNHLNRHFKCPLDVIQGQRWFWSNIVKKKKIYVKITFEKKSCKLKRVHSNVNRETMNWLNNQFTLYLYHHRPNFGGIFDPNPNISKLNTQNCIIAKDYRSQNAIHNRAVVAENGTE